MPTLVRRLAATLCLAAVAAVPAALAVTPADAAIKPKHYKNCTALNKVYPHGVGRAKAVDKTSGKKVTNFTRSDKVYSYNDKRNKATGEYDLDRDNDGIACEKR